MNVIYLCCILKMKNFRTRTDISHILLLWLGLMIISESVHVCTLGRPINGRILTSSICRNVPNASVSKKVGRPKISGAN